MCHAVPKSARPSITPSSEPQWGLPLTEPLRPYSLDYNRRSRSDGRKLSTTSTSHTRAAPSTNLLAGLDAALAHAPSQQIPSPRNWWRTGHTRLATGSPPDSSANSWHMEDSKTWESQYLRTFQAGRVCCRPQALESRKISGIGLLPGVILQAGSALKSWFCDFLNSCMRQLKIPKIWGRALVVAIPRPEKPLGDPKSYRSISLLCVPFKILETLIETNTNPLVPQERAGFWHGRSAVDQVTLLT